MSSSRLRFRDRHLWLGVPLLAALGLVLAVRPSGSRQPLPPEAEVLLTRADAARQQTSAYVCYFTLLRIADVTWQTRLLTPPDEEPTGEALTTGTINGRQATITQRVEACQGPYCYTDLVNTIVETTSVTQRRERYWIAEKQRYSECEVGGGSAAPELEWAVGPHVTVSFISPEFLQIKQPGFRDSNWSEDLRQANAVVREVGNEKIRELQCERLDYERHTRVEESGRLWICPSRQYRVVRSEMDVKHKPVSYGTEVAIGGREVLSVERFVNVNNQWYPALVHVVSWVVCESGEQWEETVVWELDKLQAGIPTADGPFLPLQRPGTLHGGVPKQIVCGSLKPWISAVRQGDLPGLERP